MYVKKECLVWMQPDQERVQSPYQTYVAKLESRNFLNRLQISLPGPNL